MYSAFFKWAAYYLENNVSSVITKLPSFLRNALGKIGVKLVRGLLDLNYLITEKYTPKHWNEEFRGLSDATKISIWTIR